MKFWFAVLCLGTFASAQDKREPVTVPAVIDHNRAVVDVEVAAPGGSERVHAWVDNGNPDLYLSRRLATVLKLEVKCDDKACSSPLPAAITVGGMSVSLAGLKEAKIPLKPVTAAAVMAAGMNAEINLPSTILRHYDVLVDFPGRKFTIGLPGSITFRGPSGKVLINPENGLIQIPSQIEKKKYNLALDLGACISFLSEEVFDKLAGTHPDWPHMTGAVGPANMWGMDQEAHWKLMRLDRVQYGPLFLTNTAVVALPKDWMDFFAKRAGTATAGLLGSQLFLNYRVGIDYARALVYFDIGRTFSFPDFDVVGLVLRPEDDGQFAILGVADFEGKPSVMPAGAGGVGAGDHLVAVNNIPVHGASMGQVWSLLGGTPGQEKVLTVERNGKQFLVVAPVRHFLGEVEDSGKKGKK